jgi:hypothetical protein
MKLTKAAALSAFKEHQDETGNPVYKSMLNDKPMIREAWNNFTDSLCKDGFITDSQYNRWSNPF